MNYQDDELVATVVSAGRCDVCETSSEEVLKRLEDEEKFALHLCFLHNAAFELWRASLWLERGP